jgi:hypothetical protein
MTSTRTGTILTAGFFLAALGVVAPRTSDAQSTLSKDECKCEVTTSKAQGTFAASKAKCLVKCQQGALAGKNPSTDCNAPYAGTTALCVQKAESKAITTESKCKDCPECYAGGNCATDAQTRTAQTETQVDLLGPVVLCNDTGSGDGFNKDEQKCEQNAALTLSKFAANKAKCYQKCRTAECAGKVPAGSCTPPASDPKTQECIAKAEGLCETNVAKKCTDAPECYPPTPGTAFCSAVESAVDSGDAATFCGSPSGAFLQ